MGAGHQPPPWLGVGESFQAAVARRPDAEALVIAGERLTYAMLHRRARTVGAALKAAGLTRGDHLGLLLDNCLEFAELLLGCALTGVIPVLFNTRIGAGQLAGRAPSLGLKGIFASVSAHGDLAAIVREAQGALAGEHDPIRLWTIDLTGQGGGDYEAFLAEGSKSDADVMAAVRAAPEEPFIIVFSAGLTGPPKTCRLNHQNVMSKVGPWAARFEVEASSRLWLPVPQFQIGFVTPFLATLFVGATVFAMEDDDASAAVELVRGEAVTHAYPIYLNRWLPLIYHLDFLPSQVPALSYCCVVGPMDVLKRTQRAAPQCTLVNTYGSPEEGGAFCMPEVFDPAELRLGTAGKPFPGHEIRIVDPVTGVPRRTGSMGEVQVRGDGVPRPATQDGFGSSFTDDGWLRTGDMGSVDVEGRLNYGGRLAEMLTIGGENVSALTIEAVLGSHPAVALAQVIGQPDADLGEVAVAFIELRPGVEVSDETLVAFCAGRLPANHAPRAVTFVTDWPTSASKILKPALAEMAAGKGVER